MPLRGLRIIDIRPSGGRIPSAGRMMHLETMSLIRQARSIMLLPNPETPLKQANVEGESAVEIEALLTQIKPAGPLRKSFVRQLEPATLLRLRSRPTITDVAKLCGVTPATVSRVLNGKKKFSTSDAVREKILSTARKLGYAPDLAARNLNRAETHIVGLFASPQTHLAEGINESLLEGLGEVLHAGGYDVFLELAATGRSRPLPFWRFDGAILMQAPKPDTVAELDRRRVPYVCVNERVGNPVAHVLSDDVMGMNRAIDHLHQLGHKRLGYANARATYFSHYSVTERYETFLSGIKERGMKLTEGHDVPFSSATEFLRTSVVDGGATAVITYDHQIAVALVGAAAAQGLQVPKDFSVICFNDVFPVALMPAPLTAVAVSGREMGRIGGDLLLNNLLAPHGPVGREIKVPEDLVVRASTAPPGGL